MGTRQIGGAMMVKKSKDKLKLFTLNSNKPLAEKIAENLGMELGDLTVSRFSDGEIKVDLKETIRGDHCYIIQSTSFPVDAHIMETLVMIDALRRASAKTVNIVIPYFGYARQDRKARPREPIAAKLVANLLETAGATRIIALDLHTAQLQGFFDIPVDHLLAGSLLADYFIDRHICGDDVVIVAPNHSGVTRARIMAKYLDAPIAIIDKRRVDLDGINVINIIGDVKNKICILLDDLIDTAETMTAASVALQDNGAKDVYAVASHAVFSGPAIKRLEKSPIKKVIVTDSICLPKEKQIDKVVQVTVAELLADAIERVYEERSVSPLFEKKYEKHM